MDKAILVIDMPKSCDECLLMFRSEEERCCMPEKRNSFTTKPNWCPLKELPEKYDIEAERNKPHDIDCDWEFESGYNVCLEEILGE